MAKLHDCKLDELGYSSMFIAGGFGGISCWLASYPQDIIKTKIQVQKPGQVKYPPHPLFPDEGITSCIQEIWAKDGWFGFWRGFTPCAIRAFWANAFMFMAYEFACEHMSFITD